MQKQTIEATGTFISPEERARLVQFCARITKNVDAAEDLAQETLLGSTVPGGDALLAAKSCIEKDGEALPARQRRRGVEIIPSFTFII